MVAIEHTRGNQVSLRWLLYDGHGNLVRTLSPDYTLSAFQWRGVWGEVQSSLGVGRGYCANLGHPEDETGLVYMRARYYEPATGRFISEDPARDGMNWYLYADGNPVAKVDSSGGAAEWSVLWFGLGVELSIVAFGIVALSSTDTAAYKALKEKLPLPHSIEWMNYAATGMSTVAIAAFALAATGLPLDMPMSRLIGISRFYLAVATVIVGAFQRAGKLSSFAPAGVALGAAFTYALLTAALLDINEFEESLSSY